MYISCEIVIYLSVQYNAEQTLLDFQAKTLQSYVKEKSFWISEEGVLADRITPGVLRSLVTLTDQKK